MMNRNTTAARGNDGRLRHWAAFFLLLVMTAGCSGEQSPSTPVLNWYIFDEPSGAFVDAAASCSDNSGGRYAINLVPLPADADQQREQLVRRLAARDSAIDIIGMDVIWTAEFAEAGWILPWPEKMAAEATRGRLESAIASASYDGRLQAAPFTTNTQLLWYRTDRVDSAPATWKEMLAIAENLGDKGTIQVQGARYEGLTVFFNSLLFSANGSILENGEVALGEDATRRSLAILRDIALSPAAPASLATNREDQSRLAFETGDSTFMVNYTFVWPSALENAPEVAENMGWARWPAVFEDRPSRVTIGGINLGVAAHGDHSDLAFAAASCLSAEDNQRLAARRGGLPPTIAALYHDADVRSTFPFADVLLQTLKDGVQRPQTPLYNDVSMAISHTLHPLRAIEPQEDIRTLRKKLERALHSEGLL